MKKKISYLALVALTFSLFAGCNAKPVTDTPPATPTVTIAATEAPVATEAVEPTLTPTETPAVTKAPEATATPAPTEVPAVTAEPTQTPEITETVEPTAAPTETPVVTEAPEATATPAPTATPTATPKPTAAPTATPKPTVAPTATPVPTKTPVSANTITYDFHNLVYSESYWMSYNVNNDGSISLVFDQQYGEIKLSLPSKVDMTQCEKVVVKAQSSYAPLSIKLYDAGFNQLYVSYSNQADGVAEFELIPEGVTSAVSGIGLMSLDNVADFSKYKVTVYSVTFHMKESYTAPTVAPTKAPSASEATLLNTYGNLLGKSGTCVSLSQLQNSTTLNHIKSQYNSVTSENEMKPDAMLGWSANLISVDAAKDLGYVIPDNYKETTVPKINFSKVDETLRICASNGLGYRAHTLVWHSQTPNWFFRTGYSASGSFVSKDVMDARMEFYIRTVMTHIHGGAYSDVVYSWDIVNEYLHADDSNWKAVYGDMGLTPTFVKKAYEIADDVLKDFGIRDEVSLIFNDFNTYMEVNEILSVVKYINSNGKICDGIGMQAHLDTGYPSPALFKDTLQAFVNAGLEVQITELDVTNTSEAEQAAYLYELMTGILQVKKNGGNITGLTFWGLADNLSWRSAQSPLLFSVFNTPKKSYEQVLEAYTDAGYKVGK